MKCVIFCGGKGTRMREETEFIPKPLVEIGGRPILWHIMKHYSHYGIHDFILPLGYKGEMIKRYFMEYRWRDSDFSLDLMNNKINYIDECNCHENWNISFVDTGLESKTGLRLYKVKKLLENEEEFCLTYGDGVSDVNLQNLISYHKQHQKIVTVTGIHPKSKYGVMETSKDNLITQFAEKPMLKDLINAGYMVINHRFFDYLTDENVMLEVILPSFAEKREIISYEFHGFWHCMDTYKDYEDLNNIWNSNQIWKVWD